MSEDPHPIILVVHPHAVDERLAAAWADACQQPVQWRHVVAERLLDGWSQLANLSVPRVVLRADCQTGQKAIERCLRTLEAAGPDALLIPLSNTDARHYPALAGGAPLHQDSATLDIACHLLAEPLLLPTQLCGSEVWLAAGPAVRDLQRARQLLDCSMFVGVAGGLQHAPPLPDDPRERAPEPLWADLAMRLAALPAAYAPPLIGLDEQPVVLHLLHGWGGGAQRWVLDLAAVDPDRHHLILRACSSSQRSRHGERLQLLDARHPDVLLRDIRLAPEIDTLADEHPHYRAVLQQLLAQFCVTQVWVSSLIGHALEALDADCELRWIAHDYFPFWPVLHVNFGDHQRRFDRCELAQDLAGVQAGGAMREEGVDAWQQRRERLVDALLRRRTEMICPDVSVRDNLQRMLPALAQLPWRVIAHGVDLLPWCVDEHASEAERPPGARLRVLIPGRIQGGKGLDLLLPALQGLLEHCELYLLGCGAAGMQLFGRSGVHIELDYASAELPALVARIQPDLALLPRTVAESFSYVLSEMWALGVPVLATQLGSLSTRITEGENGFLCAPQPQALIDRMAQLAKQPERLRQMAQHLRRLPQRSRAQMLADYQPVLPTRRSVLPAPPHHALATELATLHCAGVAARLQLDCEALRQRIDSADAEVLRRGEWGQSLSRLVDERTRWAQALESQLLNEREVSSAAALLQELQAEQLAQSARRLSELSDRLSTVEAELESRRAEQDQLLAALHEAHGQLQQAHNQLQTEQQRVAAFINSSSWRLTRPLRAIMRLQRRLAESIAWRLRSLRQLLRRGLTSLRQRGLTATLQRLFRGASSAPVLNIATQPMSAPELPFASFDVPAHASATPRVSIIIPVYNKFAYTEACLRSLARVQDDTVFETIVVDDGSSDQTWACLQQIGGIRAHRNAQNLGFIGACNKGAELARGEYLFFLNNDTQVQDGFLAELLKVFVQQPDAGLVGSKLIYPDGRLQECGGIIFSDGSGWNYGRFDDPQHAWYSYVREVDYVSGAAIALRRSLFEQLGGFDLLYAPAYYEDTDLAFKVRAHAGLKVYVAPASRVVHFEGVTSGTDLNAGIKRYQVVNQQKFLERWSSQLAPHPAPGSPILKARQHRAQRRVLVIDACTPMPDQDSGSLRMFNLLRLLLQDGAAVTFFNESRAYHAGYAEALQQLGVEMLFHPWLGDVPTFFRERGSEFDLVILSRHYVAERFLPLVRDHAAQAKVWFDTVDLHYLRERRAAELSGDTAALKAALHTQAQECSLMQRCDLTLVVSAVEQQLLAQDCPAARVEILSNIHDIPGRTTGPEQRRDICFVGGFQHPPNVDAVLWFTREVWPLVRAQAPDLVLHLIGSRTPPEIAALDCEHIRVHGFVADLEPYMANCRLSVAPLRYGAGVKGKVNMSMSHGLPVVATSVAVEGMFLQCSVDVLIADEPAAFAAAIVTACTDDALWLRLSDAALDNVRRHFSLDAARAVLARLYTL